MTDPLFPFAAHIRQVRETIPLFLEEIAVYHLNTNRYVPSHVAVRLTFREWTRLSTLARSLPHEFFSRTEDPATGRRYLWLYLPDMDVFKYIEFPEPPEVTPTGKQLGPYAFNMAWVGGKDVPDEHDPTVILAAGGETNRPFPMEYRNFTHHARYHSGLGH
jgi:hypothetical protein